MKTMAQVILDFEARRDPDGHLAVYDLPSGDGGGKFEVAGINDRYHPREAHALAAMVRAGWYDLAENAALHFIMAYTNKADAITLNPAVNFFLRDCIFNRGPLGGVKILQRALGVAPDGAWGPVSQRALAGALEAPGDLLVKLREAREAHERIAVGRDEGSKFWRGLAARWDMALAWAIAFGYSEGEPTDLGEA